MNSHNESVGEMFGLVKSSPPVRDPKRPQRGVMKDNEKLYRQATRRTQKCKIHNQNRVFNLRGGGGN